MYKTINGWTIARIVETIQTDMSNKPSHADHADGAGICAYRGANGNKCAIGVFIPDSEYKETMERIGVYNLLKLFPNLQDYMPLPLDALAALQDIHDAGILDRRPNLIAWVKANVVNDTPMG